MDETIASVKFAGGYVARVLFVEDWSAFGWQTPFFTNGPFLTAEEAAEALGDELDGKVASRVLDVMIARCRRRGRLAA